MCVYGYHSAHVQYTVTSGSERYNLSLQETTGHEPEVYRFLPRDVLIYRITFAVASLGAATAVVYVIRMAIGSVPPKRE